MKTDTPATLGRRRSVRMLARLAATGLGLALAVPVAFAAPAAATPGSSGPPGQASSAPVSLPMDEDRLELSRYSKWTRPLLGVVIALDPGHNGGNFEDMARISQRISDGRGGATACDSPGTSTHNGYREHEFTFAVAELLTERLEYLGATVVSTREDDEGVGPCGDVRGRFAEDHDVDALLSLHAISSRDPEDTGFMVVVADPPLAASQEEPSRDLALAVADAMHAAGFESDPDAGEAVQGREDLAALNFARRPAVRVELGQMYNRTEAELMESDEGRAAYAEALAEGVLNWASVR